MPIQPYAVAPVHAEPAIQQKFSSLYARLNTLRDEYQHSEEQWNVMSRDVMVHFQEVMNQIDNCSQVRHQIAQTEDAMSASPRADNAVLQNARTYIKMMLKVIPVELVVAGGPTPLETYLDARLWTCKVDLKRHEALRDGALEKMSVAIDALHVTLNSAREAAELLQKMSLCVLEAPDSVDADMLEEGVQEREIDAIGADLTQADADVEPQLVGTALNEGAGDLAPY